MGWRRAPNGAMVWVDDIPQGSNTFGQGQPQPQQQPPNYNPTQGFGPNDNPDAKYQAAVDDVARKNNRAKDTFGDLSGTTIPGEVAPYKVPYSPYYYGQTKTGAQDATQRYQNMGANAQGRGAYQLNSGPQDQARAFQNIAANDYLSSLRSGDLASTRAMQQGLGQSQANTFSMANSARGGGANQAAAMRNAMQTNASQANAMTQQGAINAMKERDMLRQGLAGTGGQMRGQDIGFATNQGNLEMQQRGLNDASQLGYERLGADVQSQQLQAAQNWQQAQQQAEQAQREENFGVRKYNADASKSGLGAVGTIIGGILSDERLKKDVSPVLESNPYSGPSSSSGALSFGDPSAGVKEQSNAIDADKKERDRRFQDSLKKASESMASSSKSANQDMMSGASSLGMGLGSMLGGISSDKSRKKDKQDAKADNFARAMQPKTYRYKDESEDSPKHYGVMAQDMEKSEMGNQAVVETPMGKMVDIKQAMSAALAEIASLRKEVDALRGRKGK